MAMGSIMKDMAKKLGLEDKPKATAVEEPKAEKKPYKLQQRVNEDTMKAYKASGEPSKAKAYSDKIRQSKTKSGKASGFDTGYQAGQDIKMEKKKKGLITSPDSTIW